MNKLKNINQVVSAFQILFALLGFCLTIFIGSLIHSEISKLFWTAIVSGLVFFMAGRYLAFIFWELLFKNKMQDNASQKPKTDEVPAKGNIVNIIQEAEKPKI